MHNPEPHRVEQAVAFGVPDLHAGIANDTTDLAPIMGLVKRVDVR
jgi:hypothetical protein